MAAISIMPVLPQEKPGELEKRIQNWDADLQPQTAAEHELVQQAVRLSYAIECGERMETAHMSRRVRQARRGRTLKIDAQRKHLRELERRLLYIVGPEEVHIDKQPPWADDPWLLVRELKEFAEGCRWLIERWEEYRKLLEFISKWDEPVLIRFIRLQGKDMVESVFDPKLNAIFLAWDVLVPRYATVEWESYRKDKPITLASHNHRLTWHEITERPKDPAHALAVLHDIVDEHVDRLKQLLIRNEALEAAEAEEPDWAEFAALDCSLEFERHRRGQSARSRELLRTLDKLLKMRNAECGMRNGEKLDEECQRANDECQMAEEKRTMANDECQIAKGELQVAKGELQEAKVDLQEASEIGVALNRESAIQNPNSEKAPNEANLVSTQSNYLQAVESRNVESLERERTQSTAGGQVVQDAGTDRVETIVPAGMGGGNARDYTGPSLPGATTGGE